MSTEGTRYTVGTGAIAVLVAGVGVLASGADAAGGVVLGAGVAAAVQVGIFWSLFVWALPGQSGLAHGLGAIIRFAAVAGMALIGVGAMGLPPAPTLFSMVACLFGSTLLEALILRRRGSDDVRPGTATIRTQH